MIDAINNDRPRYGGDGNGLTDGQFKSMYPVARRSGGGRRASGGGGGGASKAASEAANAAKKYADLVANQNQHIEMLALETKAVGMSEQAARAMLLTQELLNKAQQGGTKVTAEQTLAITKLAEETAIAEEKLRQTKETFDFISSTAKGFFKDFFEGIKNGESVWESFKEAGLNALEKIADKLIDMALQNLFANAFSGGAGNDPWAGLRKTGGGGGGGIFDILGSLFGGFFAEGGDVRGGKAIVVGEQGPELFMPKTAGSIIPNHAIHAMNNNQPSAANGNGGTLHVTGQFEVINGNIIPVMTKVAGQVSGQQIATAAPMIAGTAVKRASENVVPTMSRYQNDRAGSDYRVA